MHNSLNLTRDPDAKVVHLRPVPTDADVRRHPSRPRLDMTAERTVPLTFAGGEWSLIVDALHRSPYPAVQQCGDVIAHALEAS